MADTGAKYRIGMIGVGRMGTNHANGFGRHPLTEIIAVADPDHINHDLDVQPTLNRRLSPRILPDYPLANHSTPVV
jgi:predicted dehydrogenase